MIYAIKNETRFGMLGYTLNRMTPDGKVFKIFFRGDAPDRQALKIFEREYANQRKADFKPTPDLICKECGKQFDRVQVIWDEVLLQYKSLMECPNGHTKPMERKVEND